MTKILTLLVISLVLAYLSEKNILVVRCCGKRIDLALITLIVILVFFCGLRTEYDDTGGYIHGFLFSMTPAEYLDSHPSFFGNPLFYVFQAFFRHFISDNPHIYLLLIAWFTIGTMVLFLKKYSRNFVFSILFFFAIGLYLFTFAAVKQCLAISFALIAIDKLLEKKYLQFSALLLIAVLFHAYAIMLIILPLFLKCPWTKITYCMIVACIIVLITFESTIVSFLELADSVGKEIAEEVVLETVGISYMRLAVFAVPVLISFFFKRRLTPQMKKSDYVFTNMSIFSFLVMLLGLFSGGNLFGRSAHYFSMGTAIVLPQMIDQIFEKRSSYFVLIMAAFCYMAFFIYGNISFAEVYRSISIYEFVMSLF